MQLAVQFPGLTCLTLLALPQSPSLTLHRFLKYSYSDTLIACFNQVSTPAATSKGPTAAGGAASSGTVPATAAASSAAHAGGAAAAQAAARSATSPPKAVRQTSATMSVQEKQLAGLLKRQVFLNPHTSLLL